MQALIHPSYSGTDAHVVARRDKSFILRLLGTENFKYTSEINISYECLEAHELTIATMHLSEKTLSAIWANEDDDKWEKLSLIE